MSIILDCSSTLKEPELISTKEDEILEHAEIVSYTMLIQLSERANAHDTIPIFKQSLQQEEKDMVNWIIIHTPTMLDQLC